jgi:hypothetical protein
MTINDRLDIWKAGTEAKLTCEDPEDIAGRDAEVFLKSLVESNLRYKGAHCFLGKRVPHNDRKNGGRYEIDLVVLTKKHIYLLEVKNWSGHLLLDNGNWIQVKRSGVEVDHSDLHALNLRKQRAVLEFLEKNGVGLGPSFVSQKIIFMNRNLTIAPALASNADIVPREMLDSYLASQKGASKSECIIHSLIELCLDGEKSGKVLGGLFQAMRAEQFEGARKLLEQLETWDRVVLYGGKVIPGDCYTIKLRNSSVIDVKQLPSNWKIRVLWTRSRFFGLLKVFLTKRPLARMRLPEKWQTLHQGDTLNMRVVMETENRTIPMSEIECIIRG